MVLGAYLVDYGTTGVSESNERAHEITTVKYRKLSHESQS